MVFVTPFWEGQGDAVQSIETVTSITAGGCKITSVNQASNYLVNVLAIDPTQTSIGTLGVYTIIKPKKLAGPTTIDFPGRLKSNDPVVLVAPRWTSPVGFQNTSLPPQPVRFRLTLKIWLRVALILSII